MRQPNHFSPTSISYHPSPPPSTMSDTSPTTPPASSPSILNWTLGFLLVGLAWGLTTPFIRRAALNFHPPSHPSLERIDTTTKAGWVRWRILKAVWTVVDLLRSPAYAVPLVVNLTGSVWFFLLIGKAGRWGFFFFGGWRGRKRGRRKAVMKEKGYDFYWESNDGKELPDYGIVWQTHWATLTAPLAELSLTVPITNSLAFLFTVLGEWWAEGKVISRGTYPPSSPRIPKNSHRYCCHLLIPERQILGSEWRLSWAVSRSVFSLRVHELGNCGYWMFVIVS